MAQTAAAKAVLPDWIRPQPTEHVTKASGGGDWLHEIRYDGFRMHARLDHGPVLCFGLRVTAIRRGSRLPVAKESD
jgi:ATP-dependent DNA ligase